MHTPSPRSLLTFAILGTVAWIGQASGQDAVPQPKTNPDSAKGGILILDGSTDLAAELQEVRVLPGGDDAAADPAAGTSAVVRLVPGGTGPGTEAQPSYSVVSGGRVYTQAPATPKSYSTLLKTIEVPADRETYGDFYNYGYSATTSYGGKDDLPPGYWVYVSPNWLIYRDAPGTPGAAASRSPHWEPTQVIGAPDTLEAGDIPTAWASQTPDSQREWVDVTFDAPQKAAALLVYESYNPGALDRVTVYSADGREAEGWVGVDPTKPTEASGVSAISIKAPFEVARARLHLNSPAVAGWNEIDAVGLVDASGKTHWATGASASSTYAQTVASFPIVTTEKQPARTTRVRRLRVQ
jgi:hypothetical protein